MTQVESEELAPSGAARAVLAAAPLPASARDTGALDTGAPEAMSPPAARAVLPARLAGIAPISTLARAAGLQRVHVVAWRDLDDPEAGGSELHAHRIASLWAAAGVDVTVRTSAADGHPAISERDGYHVVRKSGRYSVFPRTMLSGSCGRSGSWDGLVEIWNGMPFFSPVWSRSPRIVFLHHVHAEMWDMVLPKPLARIGKLVERRLAPPFYRRTRIVTLSESSRSEIVDALGLPAENVTVVPPGIEASFSPGGQRSPHPFVVAVGRLVPVKRFDELIEALVVLRERHPRLEATIIGEGYLRSDLEALVERRGAGAWLRLAGHVGSDALVAAYRRAWLVASASAREGWGMTLTEAAACGTPAVVSRTVGHLDAVVHGQTGFLAEDRSSLVGSMHSLLSDPLLRARLGTGALARAQRFTWAATARATFEVLAEDALARRRPAGRDLRRDLDA